MEQYCAPNDVNLLQIREISKPESVLKLFYFVFKFDDEKIETPDLWSHLNNTAQEWLSCAAQRLLKTRNSLFSEKNSAQIFLTQCAFNSE